MQRENDAPSVDPAAGGSRRGVLAAMLAGSALGLTAIGGMVKEGADAKGKTKRRRKNRKGISGEGNAGNGSLPSIQYVFEDNTSDTDGVFAGFAQCPAGYLPIGGGFLDAFPDAVLLASYPKLVDREWAIEVSGAVEGDIMTVVAVCLRANDDSPDDEKKKRSRGKKGRGRKKR